MAWVPSAKALVAHVAVRVLPLPASATAEQPEIEPPAAVKLTLPVGAAPVTLAVKLTLAPTIAGLAELDIAVVVAALIICDTVELAEAAFALSPP